MSELVWVAVPGGVREGKALVRVLIDPRLTGGSLAGDGMQSWPPPALADEALELDFAPDGGSPDATNLRTLAVTPDIDAQAGLWERWFTHMPVERSTARATGADALDLIPSSKHATDIRETFGAAAEVAIGAVAGPTRLASFESVVRAQLAKHWSGPDPPLRAQSESPAIAPSAPDFHGTISLLREHPSVLRALGLILVLRVPEADLPSRRGFMRVRWPAAPEGLPPIVSPWTRYGSQFLPSDTENISAGMVTLTDDRPDRGETQWQVETVDVDLAVGRLRDAARALVGPPSAVASPASGQPPPARPATLPAFRSAGPQLVRRDREADFAARLRTWADNARRGIGDVVLTADDLLLGYRIDIKPGGGEWFSLQLRRATYRLHDITAAGMPGEEFVVIGAPEALEEGHTKAYAGTKGSDDKLSADEIVVRWSGWSLAVPRPNLAPQDAVVPQGPFQWTFEVREGSLPRLRFGRRYAMRARVADMAGGGLNLGDPAAERCATDEALYARFEPVASPDVTLDDGVLGASLGPAEAVDHVVLRSDPSVGLGVVDFAEQHPRYPVHAGRRIHPPRTTLAVVEQHGMFDLEGDDQDAIAERTWEWVKRTFASNTATSPRLPDPATSGVAMFPRPEPGSPNAVPMFPTWRASWPDLQPLRVELTTAAGGPPVMEWEGDQVVVRLAPAEQLTLDVSALLRKDILAHFAVAGAGMPAPSVEAANEGRHPMVTPSRGLTLVHAVRRPLRPPEPALDVTREAGQTFATLQPRAALFGVDPKSTGQVEVTATWTDHVDDGVSVVTDAPVRIVTVDRSQTEFSEPLRHEFGDTRHRKVSYSVKAVSRFRPYFHEDDRVSSVTEATAPEPVLIPSSARPAAPILMSIVPAFRWEHEATFDLPPSVVTRRRFGRRLRLELQPPWNQTGEGELLGLVVGKFRDEFEEPQLWPFSSLVGGDPIRTGGGVPKKMTAGMFTDAAPGGREVLLDEIGLPVRVIPHAVELVDGRWFCDVGFDIGSYSPLVELAIARYQPNSLDTLWLSPIVKTEMVPVLPDRTLTLKRSGDQLTVVLAGLGSPFLPRQNRVDVILEHCVLPPGARADRVSLTAFDPPTDGTPAWVAVPGQIHEATIAENRHPGLLHDTWTATMSLPSDLGPLRVRVREVEFFAVSFHDAPPPQTGTSRELEERVVFTDVVDVAAGR